LPCPWVSRRFLEGGAHVVNMISDLEAAAANARSPLARGASMPSAVLTAQPRNGADVFACPRVWASDAFGQRRSAADLGVALGRRNPGKQYPHTTRIAAASGGAEGPHPPREPA
jgi:hypothetical protein